MSLARRPWFVILFFVVLVLASRLPLAPGQLFTFDDVNLAYSMSHYDIRASQPHPPGYPLFVMEMRILHALRFRRPESILLTLALAGSIAVLLLLVFCGNRMFGGDSGFFAACLLVLHPVFWHSGVTSALRVQLALVSIVVGAACWHAWRGDGRWVLPSAIALALGAGIRPELGPLLFPLWAAAGLRAPVSWRQRGVALASMAAVVAAWLLPAMFASGGPVTFVRACLDYISDQASVSSGLFGAAENRWQTSFWRLMIWTFCGLLAWGLAAVLAWRRPGGWGLRGDQAAFLALWFLPPFGFAILVHVEDPGHTLALSVVVCLFGGYLVNRAIDNLDVWISRWHVPVLVAAAIWVTVIIERWEAPQILAWLPPVFLALGLALKFGQAKNSGSFPKAYTIFLVLAPVVIFDLAMFNHRGWYFRGSASDGPRAAGERVLSAIVSGLALTSRDQIESTLAVDDHSIREVRRLAAGQPGETLVIWERGLTTWRKIAYYAADLPIAVLDHQKIRSGSPPVVAFWKGPLLEHRRQGAAPLRLTLRPGMRIVWVLNPRTEFHDLVSRSFPLTAADPVYYTDLPRESGSRTLGEYQLVW